MKEFNEQVTVIIPAYNEEAGVGSVIEQVSVALHQAGILHGIIVVDDGSEDRTPYAAQRAGAHVLRHSKNCGYGSAIKTGINASRHEIIVIIDADGTYPPDSIPDMLKGLRNADMVVGARVGIKVRIPMLRKLAKWLLKRLAEYLTGEVIPDLNSGMRAFRCRFVRQYLNILPDKFSFTTTITVAMLCDNYRIAYTPIDYHQRVGKSKIVPWNFIEFVTLLARLSMLFKPLRVFVPAALVCFSLGGLKLFIDLIGALQKTGGFAPLLFTQRVISQSALILLISGLQVLLIGMVADGITRKIAQRMPPRFESYATVDSFSEKSN